MVFYGCLISQIKRRKYEIKLHQNKLITYKDHVYKEHRDIVATAVRTRAVNWVLNAVLCSLNSVHNGSPIDTSIHHGHGTEEFPSTCTSRRVRLRSKKQSLEEMEWNIWHVKNSYVLIAREIIISFSKSILLL